MVYTLTFNPSIDYIVAVPNYRSGIVNRTSKEEIYPGGKGINVSIVLKNLGVENKSLGFIAGFTGYEIEKQLHSLGCNTNFVTLKNGMSRINVKIKAEQESEINGQGPIILDEELEKLYAKLHELKDGDSLVLAGSIPNTLPVNIYEKVLCMLEDRKISVIVDATGDLLKNILKYKPFLVKPNQHELGDLFGTKISSRDECVFYAKQLQELGARNVLVSMAEEGAVLLTEEEKIYYLKAPKGIVVNSVGAGDSMVAGFLAGYIKTNDFMKAFQLGIAAGSASAFTNWLPSEGEILGLLPKVEK
ncbi:1-phosphofructokinase [Clostridium sp. Marseille-P299]|uniref:1-phosphofructokinase n=1 Tax=Clostridium sp. Marseille-P299 TaxID=1805477 RepID=UPI00082E9EF0|nr:1-phosphofructokinase [Clostridium sp. Marseille-P299]